MRSYSNNSKYTVAVITAGVLWGIISIFIRSLTASGASLIQILTIRAVLSTTILLCFLLITDKSLLKIELKDFWMFVGTGIISFTLFSLCYFFTILESGASVAVVLLYTSPIFVLILSAILFHEKITLLKGIALVLTFCGCVLTAGLIGTPLSSGVNGISIKGFAIGLGAGLGYALYSVFSRIALKKYRTMTIIFYTFLFSTVVLVPFAHLGPLVRNPSTSLILSSLGISIFGTVLPYILYTFGLKGLETGKAALFVTIEPLVGTVLGLVVYKEDCNFSKICGISLIFISLILCGIHKKDKLSKN